VDTSDLVIERCAVTRLYVGYIPGFARAHAQGETIEELRRNIEEVVSMLREDTVPVVRGE
jgi:predicted RNase H-like HicB family nuclease